MSVNIHLYQNVHNVNIIGLVSGKHDNINPEIAIVSETDRTKRLNPKKNLFLIKTIYFYPTLSKNTFNCLGLFIFRIILFVSNIQEIICLNGKLANLLIRH